MAHIETEITINSDASMVFKHLTDFASFTEWNPFIINLEHHETKDGHLNVTLQLPGEKSQMKFSPKIVKLEPNKELRWVGTFLGEWFFRGEHYFLIEQANQGIRFVQGEHFNGLLGSLYMWFARKKVHAGFTAMNEALKKRCEK